MMLPTELAELIRRTPGQGPFEETFDTTIIIALLDDSVIFNAWLGLVAFPPDYISSVTITETDSDVQPDEGTPPTNGMSYRITIAKQAVPNELRLLLNPFTVGWADSLHDVDNVRVAEMASDATFTTCRSRFQTWTLDPPAAFAAVEPLRDPRISAQDFTQANVVVADIRPWLVTGAPHATGPTYGAWRALASRRLIAALSDRVSLEGGKILYYFGGPPSCQFSLDDAQADALFDRLTAGATWVFVEGHRDTDTRHLLLANEWARTFRKEKLLEVGDGALDSAKGAYSAYVKAGSKETLKAIADLRKAVVDETQKVSQRAQDLAGAMWKDLAVASAPFVTKILADSAKISNLDVAGGMALVAAAFLVFSFFMMVSINRRYFARQDEGRKVWSATLSTVLTPSEIEEYSAKPIQRSIEDYKAARLRVGIFYIALVIILLAFAENSLSSQTVVKKTSDSTVNVSATMPRSVNAKTIGSAPPGQSPLPVKKPTLPKYTARHD